jgi:hypothetical protein
LKGCGHFCNPEGAFLASEGRERFAREERNAVRVRVLRGDYRGNANGAYQFPYRANTSME